MLKVEPIANISSLGYKLPKDQKKKKKKEKKKKNLRQFIKKLLTNK